MSRSKTSRAESIRVAELRTLVEKVELYPMSSRSWGSPTLLPFVRGLMFSSEIIEIARKHVRAGFNVDWGQIIDLNDGSLLSRESDIIIYEGLPYKDWENKTMRFVIADKAKTRVVIQCSTRIDSISDEHKEYCKNLLEFVHRVWYFAECCWVRNRTKIKRLENNLKKVGYSNFFYLYTMNENSLEKQLNEKVLIRFINLIEKIK